MCGNPGHAGAAACDNDPHRETFRAVLLAQGQELRGQGDRRQLVHPRVQALPVRPLVLWARDEVVDRAVVLAVYREEPAATKPQEPRADWRPDGLAELWRAALLGDVPEEIAAELDKAVSVLEETEMQVKRVAARGTSSDFHAAQVVRVLDDRLRPPSGTCAPLSHQGCLRRPQSRARVVTATPEAFSPTGEEGRMPGAGAVQPAITERPWSRRRRLPSTSGGTDAPARRRPWPRWGRARQPSGRTVSWDRVRYTCEEAADAHRKTTRRRDSNAVVHHDHVALRHRLGSGGRRHARRGVRGSRQEVGGDELAYHEIDEGTARDGVDHYIVFKGLPADDRDGQDPDLIEEVSAREVVARVAWSGGELDEN